MKKRKLIYDFGGKPSDHLWYEIGNSLNEKLYGQLSKEIGETASNQFQKQFGDRIRSPVWDRIRLNFTGYIQRTFE